MYNNFYTAMALEAGNMEEANELYKSLGFTNIRRPRWDTPGGREKQRADIDVVARRGDKVVYISEKFRTFDYPDVLVELDDNWEPDVLFQNKGAGTPSGARGCKGGPRGWCEKSQAHMLFYHTPSNLYILDAQALKKHAMNIRRMWENELATTHYFHMHGKSKWVGYGGYEFISCPTYLQGNLMWAGLCVKLTLDELEKLNILLGTIEKPV